MKTSLDHLPEHKQDQLRRIAELIHSSAPIDLVILFGSYARGDWVEDWVNGYISDYDLLVIAPAKVADDGHLWAGVTERARAITGGKIPISLIRHDLKFMNREIRQSNYFFCDIVLEGILLLQASGSAQLAKPKALSPEERLRFGERHFRYWFSSATVFWQTCGYVASLSQLPNAAFQLHQATERYLHSILLVFGGYKPKTHDIQALADQAATHHPRFAALLPRREPADQELFDLLKRAYVDARYCKSYTITLAQLTTLREQVRELALCAREICGEKLATILGPQAVGELPEAPLAGTPSTLPALPPSSDPLQVLAWKETLMEESRSKGVQEGRSDGLREGEQRGIQMGRSEGIRMGRSEGIQMGRSEGMIEGEQRGRAHALVDLLRLRGLLLTDSDEQRILNCKDSAILETWWSKALQISHPSELFANTEPR